MQLRQKRFMYIMIALVGLGLVIGLVLYGLKNNVSLYFTPTQVFNKEAPVGRSFRIGGLVEAGSMQRLDGLTVKFVLSDLHKSIPVTYKGILPDLFKEGKGAVVQGRIEADGVMHAQEVLAKHDENYMPPEAVDALKKGQAANAADKPAYPATVPVTQ
ncbi:MAG TPA: cytochrome c maturation protein CcmE [Gallionella sp.]|nr:cytochrome c maturation protein CcmE [Gallionella sp.]